MARSAKLKAAIGGKAGDGRRKNLFKATALAIGGVLAALIALKLASVFFPNIVDSVRALVGDYGLFGTFVVVLLGSTLLPFSVDVYFIASLQVFKDPLALTAVAIVAGTIGSFINYFLANFLSRKWLERQVGKENVSDASDWFNAWGGWALLVFGALPLSVVFDPLTFIAGMSRMDLGKYAAFVIAARVLHFGLLAGATLGWLA